jgi:uncharacterized protein YbjT (DUF2867 family)
VSGRILLVGGTGFLGSHVARLLADRDLTVLVRPSSDQRWLPHGLEVRLGDLEQRLPLEGIETLVFCASMGFGHVPSVVEQMERASVQRAVFVSTTAIFTHLPAASRAVRLEAEQTVMRSQIDWTILRPTMIYGSARDRNISRLLRYLARWSVFPVCADALWQPIFVEDLAQALVAALDTPGTATRAYNLAGAAALRFSELVRTAARAVGRRNVLLPRVPLQVAVRAARMTRVVTPEQVLRLAEDKAFDCSEAARDFAFSSRTFATGARLEAQALGLAR